jgi:integrase
MGTVFKKTFTKPLPAGAEVITRQGVRFARWKPPKGKTQTAPLTTGRDGSHRIVLKAGTYTAKYRDGSGIVQERATGCRDKEAASRVLSDLERRAELVKSKVMTAAEDAISDHQDTPLAEHFAAYIVHQRAKGLNETRMKNTESRLNRLAADCGFRRLGDLHAANLLRWLVARQAEDMGAGNRNEFRQELVGFGNWCVRTERLLSNPFAEVPKADAKADCRRKRRAMTEGELTRLLESARRRPLLDRMTIRQGTNKGKAIAKVRAQDRAMLEKLGWERALLYKTLLLTGLRKKELRTLAAGQLELDGPVAYAVLDAADEKNREGSSVAIREDLAADLRKWLANKLNARQDEARRRGEPIPAKLPTDALLFNVPSGLLRILNRDLRLAGIPKTDERGRTVDVHAMRHTFGTHLSREGWPLGWPKLRCVTPRSTSP